LACRRQHGVVLDILVQDRRNAAAAKRQLRASRNAPSCPMSGTGEQVSQQPCRKLASADPATRADATLQAGAAVPSALSMIDGLFRPRRHLMTAGGYRRARTKAFRI
jgi:putative transposase